MAHACRSLAPAGRSPAMAKPRDRDRHRNSSSSGGNARLSSRRPVTSVRLQLDPAPKVPSPAVIIIDAVYFQCPFDTCFPKMILPVADHRRYSLSTREVNDRVIVCGF